MSPELLFDSRHTRFGMAVDPDAPVIAKLEALGVESFWAGGHVAYKNASPEAITYLARLVELTHRAMVGTAILLLPLYPPAVAAKQVAELDLASQGRLVLGIGVGGEDPKEFAACHVPMSERGTRTSEAMGLLRRFWTGEPVDHPGPHFPLEGACVFPAPAQPGGPPIVVAGRKPPAMRRAALLGDGWMPYLYTPRLYRESVERIRGFASEAGRSLSHFAWMFWAPIHLGKGSASGGREISRDNWEGPMYKKSVYEVIAVATEYVDAGVRYFIFYPGSADPVHVAQQLQEVVMPALNEALPD